MSYFDLGRQAGVDDARSAWCALKWERVPVRLPVKHFDRQEFLAGYASGLAEFNRAINPL